MGFLSRSLVAKISVAAALAVALPTAAGVALLIRADIAQATGEIAAKADIASHMVAPQVSEALWNLSPDDAAAALTPLRGIEGFAGAVVYGELGEVFHATRRIVAAEGDIVECKTIALKHADGDGREKTVGSLEIRFDLGYVKAAVQRKVTNMVMVGALACLLVVAAVVFLMRGVAAPITRMTQAMAEVASGEIDIVVPGRHREDEIGRMAEALRQFQHNAFELHEAKARAEGSEKAKAKFFAAASHDLRQPVQSLMIFAEILRADASTDKARRTAEYVSDVVGALKGLLDGLLDVSRLDAGGVSAVLADVGVGGILRTLRNQFDPVARRKGLALAVEESSCVLRTDQVLLQRMLGNLMENAIRYTKTGGITVVCVPIGGALRIEVRDTGIGIPADQMERIFDEFHQIGNPERNRDNGVGLGLSIVRRLSALLGHPVSVRSALGVGTVFAVEVPIAGAATVVDASFLADASPANDVMPVEVPDALTPLEAAAPRIDDATAAATVVASESDAPLPPQSAVPVADGRAVVLLVDDDPVVREGLEMFLDAMGYRVLAADDVGSAVRTVSEGAFPDFVMSDFNLPDGNGLEVIDRVRAIVGRRLPAAILSGRVDAELRGRAEEAGVATAMKPIPPAALTALAASLAPSTTARAA